MTRVFPFGAVIGQERLKLALLLCAIDPGIGGLLVRGPRGVAKTTLARAFAELLPGRFVELPLGATEERVTGTLDLEAALEGKKVVFSPGLLGRAHEGVLYVDEANLLSDGLVDVLLDAAASGTNIVERDGVSHAHPARFVLVGTMNPEEGELRPQFIDRFGLSVHAGGDIPPVERAEIVLRRLEFDRDPEGFSARFAKEQRALIERCARARERVTLLPLEGAGLERVTELCHAARVEGVRADLAMLRAARAHAAWHERESIEVEDVDAVAELALAHRRQRMPEPSGSNPTGGSGTTSGAPSSNAPSGGAGRGGSRAGTSAGEARAPEAESIRAAEGDARLGDLGDVGDRGSLPPVPVRPVESAPLPAWLMAERRTQRRRRWLEPPTRPARRRAAGAARITRGSIDWFGTLARCPAPSRTDLRYRARRGALERLWVIALDCSASMLQSGALAIAKGVARALAVRATSGGAHVALISFGGRHARTEVISSSRSRELERAIGELGAGGGTPLRHAVLTALAVCKRPAYGSVDVDKRLSILTDGRTREDLTDLRRRCLGLELGVIDCERGAVRLGRARRLALALGARYVHVESFAAGTGPGGNPSARLDPGP